MNFCTYEFWYRVSQLIHETGHALLFLICGGKNICVTMGVQAGSFSFRLGTMIRYSLAQNSWAAAVSGDFPVTKDLHVPTLLINAAGPFSNFLIAVTIGAVHYHLWPNWGSLWHHFETTLDPTGILFLVNGFMFVNNIIPTRRTPEPTTAPDGWKIMKTLTQSGGSFNLNSQYQLAFQHADNGNYSEAIKCLSDILHRGYEFAHEENPHYFGSVN